MDIPNTKPNQIMFSLRENDDFLDHDHPDLISFQQQDQTPDLHQHDVSNVDMKGKSSINYAGSSSRKRGGNRPSNKPSPGGGGGGDGENDQIQKKMVHREMERQRRQEMAKLYASLRDLLPLEFIKGNRSISDHMYQAMHYIKEMEETVKGLSAKRDQLKSFSNSNENSNKVSVSFSNGGVEISINSCLIEDGFSLSKVLNTLVEEGLNVITCTLTKVKDRLHHSIQTEVVDGQALIDPSMLQQRLSFVANFQQDFD
ncbi:hypothetical protein SSX86_010748 [Deinandra increscens subsp. villosa]|uniref:BHLH domain-containing protein n=1 Tax=Deinandra increscens subsp. villosa TaxID=3103831 RepID=A0AAP0H3H4_9ASTR